MNSLPSYGFFFDKPKARETKILRVRAGPRSRVPGPSPSRTPEDIEKRQLAALRRCCFRPNLVPTSDHSSIICRACSTIMPAFWIEAFE